MKLIKVVALAALAFFALTAEGCPGGGLDKDGKAHQATKPVYTANGSYAITTKWHPKVRALKPSTSCKYSLRWNLPNSGGKNFVVLKRSDNGAAKVTVDLGHKYTFTYKDPRSGQKRRKKDVRATTFVTNGCGNWYKV